VLSTETQSQSTIILGFVQRLPYRAADGPVTKSTKIMELKDVDGNMKEDPMSWC
jgi:hypothetical protein